MFVCSSWLCRIPSLFLTGLSIVGEEGGGLGSHYVSPERRKVLLLQKSWRDQTGNHDTMRPIQTGKQHRFRVSA